jgi:hypothetical protein
MTTSRVAVALAILFAAVSCGGDNHHGGITFEGTVTSVTPQQSMRTAPARRWFAKLGATLLPSAVAQGTCPAKHVLACASNGTDPENCERVNVVDCGFSVSVPATTTDFVGGAFGFVDDTNDNGRHDTGETIAFLFEDLGRLCDGTVVKLDDVQIDFTPGTAHATAGSVRKDPDTCANQTPGPTSSVTPVSTMTPGATPTPYGLAAPLHSPPSTMLAMLYGAGAVGCLLPIRRRRRH